MLILSFLVLFTDPLEFGLQLQNVVVNQDGFYLSKDGHQYHQTFDGEGLTKLDASSLDTVLFTQSGYLIKDSSSMTLHLANNKGSIIDTFNNISWRYFTRVKDNLIATVPSFSLPENLLKQKQSKTIDFEFGPFLKKYDLGVNPNPFMVELVRINNHGKSVDFSLEKSFFRATQEQHSLNLNFKKMFVLFHEERFFLMTQMNNRIYMYDEETILKERATDPQTLFVKPSVPLELDGFVSVSESSMHLKPIYFNQSEWAKDMRANVYSFSRIYHFSKTDFGFLVAYSVPRLEPGLKDSIDIYVQEVDMNGQKRRPVKVFEDLQGKFAGIVNNDFYWFSKERGKRVGVVEVFSLD